MRSLLGICGAAAPAVGGPSVLCGGAHFAADTGAIGQISNAEIADWLVVSSTVIKTYLGWVLVKLGLRDRIRAVVLAYETGIIRCGRTN
jgi:hypothetical protein